MQTKFTLQALLPQKSTDIISLLFQPDLIDTSNQKCRCSVLCTDHASPAIDPDRSSLFVLPAILQIMEQLPMILDLIKILQNQFHIIRIGKIFQILGNLAKLVLRYSKSLYRIFRNAEAIVLYI